MEQLQTPHVATKQPKARWMALSQQLLREHRKWLQLQREWRSNLLYAPYDERVVCLEEQYERLQQQQQRYQELRQQLHDAWENEQVTLSSLEVF